jgi:hypothetical protein
LATVRTILPAWDVSSFRNLADARAADSEPAFGSEPFATDGDKFHMTPSLADRAEFVKSQLLAKATCFVCKQEILSVLKPLKYGTSA